jgi:site-specific DNA recombinase
MSDDSDSIKALLQGTVRDRRPIDTRPEKLNFAFYGRMSTDEQKGQQEKFVSKGWQLGRAEALVASTGVIVQEFFDEDVPRSVPFIRRPEAKKLLDLIDNGTAKFHGVVIGEAKRIFAGSQLEDVYYLLNRAGIELWIPEVGGKYIDSNITHKMVLALEGIMGKVESDTIRGRISESLRFIAESPDKRWLGGNAPYGYKLVVLDDKARNAKGYTTTLAEDPETSPVLKRIFRDYLDGKSMRQIARELTDEKIPSPSGRDVWAVGSLSTILDNQNYTGWRIYGKQRKFQAPYDENDPRLGTITKRNRRGAPPVVSDKAVYPELVSPADFARVVDIRRGKHFSNADQPKSRTTTKSVIPLQGRVYCDGRKMETDRITKSGNVRFRLRAADSELRRTTHTVLERKIELTVHAWLSMYFRRGNLKSVLKSLTDHAPNLENHISKLENQKRSKSNGAKNLLVLVELGDDAAVERYQTLQAEIRELDRDIKEAKSQTLDVEGSKLLLTAISGSISTILATAKPTRLKALYESLNLIVEYLPESQSIRVNVSPLGSANGGNGKCPWRDSNPRPDP